MNDLSVMDQHSLTSITGSSPVSTQGTSSEPIEPIYSSIIPRSLRKDHTPNPSNTASVPTSYGRPKSSIDTSKGN